ncbi:dicarboxylate/amino acid:cation symporter [Sphingomonas tabacisoli]|uniref:Dicarboxylate/amino acid:cation symporter n=1 Tax=Sphingomonas tabacisoli TaxID=2249466 RepID=A0ABW4I2T1_9SPHN
MRIFRHLYAQVLIGIALGVLVGWLWPSFGAALKPLGDAFIKLVKMMIAPIIFTTVVLGIAKIGDLRALGRVGLKALVYFEAMTTLALVIGLVVVNLVRPGAGVNANPAALDVSGLADAAGKAKEQGVVPFLLGIIPDSFFGALTGGELLPVLLVAILTGLALAHMGEAGARGVHVLERASELFFRIIAMLMKLAPIGAFGAMAFTIGKYGAGTLVQLGTLMLSVYATCLIFVFVVLGIVAWVCGFSLFAFLRYIADEILIVLGTSSSETALPRLMRKLEDLGCAKPVVGLVVPTGYSFNLDGTSIYLTMAAIFIAQATNTELTLAHQLGLLGILLLTSKGAAGVTGSGFVTLAATLSATHTVPVAGIALILGIDRFMSEARSITNLIGNGVATVAIARWEGALDRERMKRVLAGEPVDDPVLT